MNEARLVKLDGLMQRNNRIREKVNTIDQLLTRLRRLSELAEAEGIKIAAKDEAAVDVKLNRAEAEIALLSGAVLL